LNIGIVHGHDAIVLSAFGCGAYRAPPQLVAEAFREVIEEDLQLYRNYRKIVFAILDDHNTGKAHNPHGNLAPFAEVFEEPLKNKQAN
jgi:uncharacterized protein (TIGR02452 family)